MVRRAFKFRAYPTRPQEARAVRLLADQCDLYNAALEERREAWRMRRASVSYGMQSAQLMNRAILDTGWAQFADILTGKAEEAGRRVVFVNPAGTSITCHICGRECARSQQDTVICPIHGTMDADLNGAGNIATRAGLGSGQASAV